MRVLFSILLLLIFCPVNRDSLYESIQKDIHTNQADLLDQTLFDEQINVFSNFKKKLNIIEKTKTNTDNDTLYIVDFYNIEDETGIQSYFCFLWNSKKTMAYKLKGKKHNVFIKTDTKEISKYKFDLIYNWDIEQLQEESRANQISGGGFFLTTRIIFEKKNYRIETFLFNDFYNFKQEYFSK